jgi:hypothetical protein
MARYNAGGLAAWWASVQKADRREWIRVSAETGEYLRDLSGREDLIAVVEPGAGQGNLAVYVPEMAHVEVDSDKCAEGVAPADISMTTEVARLRHPAFAGAAIHEGGHAMVSKWTLDQSPEKRAVVKAALLLEESRMEKFLLAKHPEQRVFLRASFADLVRTDTTKIETVHHAARTAALCMARVDAGVLAEAEMTDLKAELIDVLGEALYNDLRAVWLDAHRVTNHGDQAAMEALGQRWVDLLPEDPSDAESGTTIIIVCGHGEGEGSGGEGGDSEGEGGESGEGSGEGSGDGEGEGKGTLSRIAEAVSAAAEDEAEGQVDGAKARDEADARKAEAGEVKKSDKAAKAVFGVSDKISHGHGYGSGEGINGAVNPPVKVRATANVLARAIQKAQHRERSKTIVSASVPPGRLKSSAAVRRSAQRSMGIPVTTEPWRQTVRKHIENPPITVGIMVDISGSMRWAETPVAEAAWAIAHAVHRNDGDTATVAYGEKVHAVTKPGENPRLMRTFDASGGTEEVIGALRALDGGLNLTNGRGVRMLVNVSDGQHTPSQRTGATAILKRMTAAGVKVLWVDMNGGGWGGTDPILMPGVEVVTINRGDDLGRLIGSAMTKALNAA